MSHNVTECQQRLIALRYLPALLRAARAAYGTAVRSADDGVVAYAGNELKGYGNLVLVRHSNGYVTAYAHASELLVKRGDKVRRGQVIAKAGKTGAEIFASRGNVKHIRHDESSNKQ